MIRKFKYGQWIVTIELHDEYWGDYSSLPELYCKIECVGTWYSTVGSIWDTWTCGKYEDPYRLPDKLKDIITKKCRRMFYLYEKAHPLYAN